MAPVEAEHAQLVQQGARVDHGLGHDYLQHGRASGSTVLGTAAGALRISRIVACGLLPATAMCVRPAYSPRMPRNTIWTPPINSRATISDAQPATAAANRAG